MKFVKPLFMSCVLVIITSAGCSNKTYEKRQYILSAIRTYPSAEENIADTIFVNRFTIKKRIKPIILFVLNLFMKILIITNINMQTIPSRLNKEDLIFIII